MRFELNIDYPPEKMERSRSRLEARARFACEDRVPVAFCLVPRYFTPLYDMPYSEFFRDVETQYYWQLQFARYRIERIPEDACCSPVVCVAPYFDNVTNASAFGAEIAWPENETLHAIPVMKHVDDTDRLEIPAPDAGLWGKRLEWWQRMKELARETKLTFNGQEAPVVVAPPSTGGEGPHMVAVDLAGTEFYWWMVEYPEACHRLLDKITKGMLRTEEYCREVDPTPRGGFGLAEDSAQIMSAAMFREFCVPYDRALYERFGAGLPDGRGMHMCGDSTHLLEALRDDLGITHFVLFGYRVQPEVVARMLGGRALLWGNINPMLMLSGTREEVKQAALQCLEALAPCGGLLLGDGANVCPGTPIENLAALTEAAEEYGLGQQGG